MGSVNAFEHITVQAGLVPALMLSMGQKAELSFGQAKVGGRGSHSRPHPQEFLHQSHANLGYQPLAQMSDSGTIPLWYSSPDSIFYPLSDAHPRLKLSRDDSSRVTVRYKHWDNSVFRIRSECLRLNVGMRVGTAKSPLPQASKVSFTAIIPAGHDPKTVFVGWTTSGITFWEEDQMTKRPGMKMEWFRDPTSSDVVCSSTAYLMCLADALTSTPYPALQSPLRYVSLFPRPHIASSPGLT